jgi:hypothetical protein
VKRGTYLALGALLAVAGIAIVVTRDGRHPDESGPSSTTAAVSPRLDSHTLTEPARTHDSRQEIRRTPEEIESVIASIQDATVQYSDATLPQFEKWLADPSREIRDAATDGLLQSGLSGGAGLLRAAAAVAKDKAEAEEQERAASILELPPATARIIEERRADGKQRPPAKHFNLNEQLNPAPVEKTGPSTPGGR